VLNRQLDPASGIWRRHTLDKMIYSPKVFVGVLLSLLNLIVVTYAFRSNGALRMSASDRKVVVTGIGVVNGLGTGIDKFWSAALEGKSALHKIDHFDASQLGCQIGSVIQDFKAKDYFTNTKSIRSNDRYTHLGVAAARLALDDAGLDPSTIANPHMFGVMIGSAFGGVQTFEEQAIKLHEKGPGKVSPFAIPALLGNTVSGTVGIEVGAKGPNFGVVSACAAATHSLGEAMMHIKMGSADVMLAGGAEACMTPLMFAGFDNMNAMCKNFNEDPTKGSRPFDMDRCGFVMAEGAGVLLLESEEHAQKRGATVYCELAGYGASCDAHHITTPDPEGRGLEEALRRAINMGGISPAELGYINAHGTSTAYNDKFETMAIKGALGEDAARALKISSTKSMHGHTIGAAGGLEAAICAKVLQTGDIPPTMNYETPDPDCDLDYTPNTKVHVDGVTAAASNNLGFGGHNGVVAFKKI